jgi:hypothetical protein
LRVELRRGIPGTGAYGSARTSCASSSSNRRPAGSAFARFSQAHERPPRAHIVRTVGIALALLGLNLWALHAGEAETSRRP